MKHGYDTEELIAALATPWGESALAVIRTSGTGSVEKEFEVVPVADVHVLAFTSADCPACVEADVTVTAELPTENWAAADSFGEVRFLISADPAAVTGSSPGRASAGLSAA